MGEGKSKMPDDAATLREQAESAGAERGRKQEAVDLWRRYLEIAEPPQVGEALLGLGRALVEARCVPRCAPDDFPGRFPHGYRR